MGGEHEGTKGAKGTKPTGYPISHATVALQGDHGLGVSTEIMIPRIIGSIKRVLPVPFYHQIKEHLLIRLWSSQLVLIYFWKPLRDCFKIISPIFSVRYEFYWLEL